MHDNLLSLSTSHRNKKLGLYEGHAIKIEDGKINLTNMWRACGGEQRNKPYQWLKNADTQRLIKAFEEKLGEEAKGANSRLYKIFKGAHGGTYAHGDLLVKLGERFTLRQYSRQLCYILPWGLAKKGGHFSVAASSFNFPV